MKQKGKVYLVGAGPGVLSIGCGIGGSLGFPALTSYAGKPYQSSAE